MLEHKQPTLLRSEERLHLQSLCLSQEEEALLSEMDVTGQAFEDMQEQNIRLMQQLREKDDANFKLMSERIKSNQIHKLLKEEKEELADQVLTLKTQVTRRQERLGCSLRNQAYLLSRLQRALLSLCKLLGCFIELPCERLH